jgi:catechol 2,3-dioxygenase-like lactoylglutathione lyase family enzyme
MIEGIDRITYGIEDTPEQWARVQRFFSDWGLRALPLGPSGPTWETLNGAQVCVCDMQDPRLDAPMEPGATLREVQWGVGDVASLQRLHQQLQAMPGFQSQGVDAAGASPNARVSCLDPHGLRQVFALSLKRPVDVRGAAANAYGDIRRIDQASPVYERATPVDIGHVVLFTDRLQAAEDFYQALGFVTSDRYPGRGVFMRCAPQAGHHDVFLLQVPGKAVGLNHVAFTVRDIHEVFGGGLHMGRCGWKTQLGPGRHPVSSAYFWYFENPCGGLIEYNADEDHLTPAWQPREFTPGPTVFAEWAIDGGIDGHTRRQPQSAAGGGFLTEKKP